MRRPGSGVLQRSLVEDMNIQGSEGDDGDQDIFAKFSPLLTPRRYIWSKQLTHGLRAQPGTSVEERADTDGDNRFYFTKEYKRDKFFIMGKYWSLEQPGMKYIRSRDMDTGLTSFFWFPEWCNQYCEKMLDGECDCRGAMSFYRETGEVPVNVLACIQVVFEAAQSDEEVLSLLKLHLENRLPGTPFHPGPIHYETTLISGSLITLLRHGFQPKDSQPPMYLKAENYYQKPYLVMEGEEASFVKLFQALDAKPETRYPRIVSREKTRRGLLELYISVEHADWFRDLHGDLAVAVTETDIPTLDLDDNAFLTIARRLCGD